MARSLVKFKVYEVDGLGERQWLGDTRAVSPEKAINNVRFRLFGETSVEDLGIVFEAEPVTGITPTPPRQPLPQPEKQRPLCGHQHFWREILRPSPVF